MMSVKSEVDQSFPTLCDSMDYIAYQVSLSMGFSRQEYRLLLSHFSHVQLCATP